MARNELWATVAWRRMFGFLPDERISYDAVIERIHPEDREATWNAIQQAVAGEGELQTQHRWLANHGSTRWMSLQGSVERDARGRAVLVRGASRDITRFKLAEAELEQRRSEASSSIASR